MYRYARQSDLWHFHFPPHGQRRTPVIVSAIARKRSTVVRWLIRLFFLPPAIKTLAMMGISHGGREERGKRFFYGLRERGTRLPAADEVRQRERERERERGRRDERKNGRRKGIECVFTLVKCPAARAFAPCAQCGGGFCGSFFRIHLEGTHTHTRYALRSCRLHSESIILLPLVEGRHISVYIYSFFCWPFSFFFFNYYTLTVAIL